MSATPAELALLDTRLLRDILQELRDIHVALSELSRSEARSHVQLEQDSKGVIKPTVKVYDGSSPDQLVEQAMATLAEAKVRIHSVSEDSIDAWQQTLDQIRAQRHKVERDPREMTWAD